jgi:hypothetical protein
VGLAVAVGDIVRDTTGVLVYVGVMDKTGDIVDVRQFAASRSTHIIESASLLAVLFVKFGSYWMPPVTLNESLMLDALSVLRVFVNLVVAGVPHEPHVMVFAVARTAPNAAMASPLFCAIIFPLI